jgi:hypothetical protein
VSTDISLSGVGAQGPQAPSDPPRAKFLNLTVKLGESTDIGEIAAEAAKLGELTSLSINTGYDYDYDLY